MLSQRLALLALSSEASFLGEPNSILRKNLQEFVAAHEFLQRDTNHLNDPIILQRFRSLQGDFERIGLGVRCFIEKKCTKEQIESLSRSSESFLKAMDLIVTLYEKNSRAAVQRMVYFEVALFLFLLLILGLEVNYIFRPILRSIDHFFKKATTERERSLENSHFVDLGRMMSSIAHELKNILITTSVSAQKMVHEAAPEETRHSQSDSKKCGAMQFHFDKCSRLFEWDPS